ncbi:GNAT family N-acetyltransferase [Streptomyces coacervatus]|uniref:GNAT family N-acetyltransferase n=1 Tax=Streptomyces coacervatus TaxID=647381 RepID=A0ABP7J8K7_9ACTN|nr:GNAT family N-acetyltransferase [Streptomyces coacervatus]MDF2270386.1 GNAT family N-acetyltransferase [Streptomyces coacervatus]
MPDEPGPCVRRRTGRDLDACVQVLAVVHEHSGYPVNWPEKPTDWLTPRSLLAAWVAKLDGRVVGHVGLSRGGRGDVAPGLWGARAGVGAEAAAVVSRLFVSPEARGHGLGAALMARAVAEAHGRGLHPVLDVVAASDTAATALYERLGWELLDVVEQRWSPDQVVTLRCYAAPSAARACPAG